MSEKEIQVYNAYRPKDPREIWDKWNSLEADEKRKFFYSLLLQEQDDLMSTKGIIEFNLELWKKEDDEGRKQILKEL